MPNYSRPGTENLRSTPKTNHAAEPEQSGKAGRDVGGRGNPRANEKVLSTDNPKASRGGYDYKVEGVQSFNPGGKQ